MYVDGRLVGHVYKVVSMEVVMDTGQEPGRTEVAPVGFPMSIPPSLPVHRELVTIRNPSTRRKAQWKTEKKGYRP